MMQFINMKITFEDWKEGRITIDGTYYSVPKEMNPPKIVFWKDIALDVQNQIRSAQKEIFENSVNEELNYILQDFNSRYKKSAYKEIFVDGEINKIKEVLFTNSAVNSVNELYRWGSISPFSYENDSVLYQIRKYFTMSYIEGYLLGFDFVNSLNSPFYLDHKEYILIPEIQGEVLHRFFAYLNSNYFENSIAYNKDFWNIKTFELFKFLSTEYTQSKPISKYNLIFHFLKELNRNEFFDYSFSMSKELYFDFIKNNICSEFISKKGVIPTMNPPETDLKDTAFNRLFALKKSFESIT